MTIKIKVLTHKGVDVNDLYRHAKHGDPEPHGATRFDLDDHAHQFTLHAKGSGFSYIGDVPRSGSIKQLIVDKGSSPFLKVDLSPHLKVSTVLGGSLENFFKLKPQLFTGNDGNDKIRTGWKADKLKGRDGNDHLDGNRGHDKINGGDGNDRLIGNKGNDVLTGGGGKDTLLGGTGHDRFVFNKLSDSQVGAADTIENFFRGQGDVIDLRKIDADTTLGGNQAFTFIGNTTFGNVPGELRFSGNTLEGDVNGDGAADFQIMVTGSTPLVDGDFLL